jgi:hypothetical protein
VHADDDVSNRPHSVALTRLEATRGCKDLHAGGTRTFWAKSALAQVKRSSHRMVPYVQVFGRIRVGWRTRSLMHVFRVGALRNALVLAADATGSMGAIPS